MISKYFIAILFLLFSIFSKNHEIKFLFLIFTIFYLFSFKINKMQIINSQITIFFGVIILFNGLLDSLVSDQYNIIGLQFWAQFIIFLILPIFIENQKKAFEILNKLLFILFILDLFTNLLLFFGFHLPWSDTPGLRSGAIIPRFGGIYNSSLFSGMLSIIMFALSFGRKYKYSLIIILLACLNMLLAGSQRYYILLAAVSFLYIFPFIRNNKSLLSIYLVFVVISIAVAVLITGDRGNDQSNFLRLALWNNALEYIWNHMFFGKGFFYPEINKNLIPNLNSLLDAGVTESTILLFGVCYGLVGLLSVIYYLNYIIFRAIRNNVEYDKLAVFLIFTLNMVIGGSLSNSLFLFLFSLNISLILNYNESKKGIN